MSVECHCLPWFPPPRNLPQFCRVFTVTFHSTDDGVHVVVGRFFILAVCLVVVPVEAKHELCVTSIQGYTVGLAIILLLCSLVETSVVLVSIRGTVIHTEPRACMTYLVYGRLGKYLDIFTSFEVSWILTMNAMELHKIHISEWKFLFVNPHFVVNPYKWSVNCIENDKSNVFYDTFLKNNIEKCSFY